MLAYTRQKFLKLLKIDFIRFCIVGGVGFLANLAILATLHGLLQINIFASQLISAEIALFANFIMHHYWTYKAHLVAKRKRVLLVQFHATSWPAIIGSTLMVGAGVEIFHLSDLVALVVSSMIALGWNFAWSKYVIWKDVSKQQVAKIAKLS